MEKTSRRAVLGVGLLGLGTAVLHARPGSALTTLPNQFDASEYKSALDDIRRFALNHASVHDLPALVISIADRFGWQDQILIGSANLEPMTAVGPEHLFQIGSISKSMTALCIFTLVADGLLSLATPIQDILPTLTLASAEPITIQHLINHTSGLPSDTPLSRAFIKDGIITKNRPGVHWNYSNLGYQLLGLVIEQVTKQSYAQVLSEKIFSPLGMIDSKGSVLQKDRHLYAKGYGPYYTDRPFPVQARKSESPWVNVTAAMGSVASTPADLSRYIHFLLTTKTRAGAPLLPAKLAEQFVTRTTKAPGWEDGADFANGLALIKRNNRILLHHTGGMIGFSSSMHVDMAGGVAALASTNVGHLSYRPGAVTEFACRRLLAIVEQREYAAAPTKLTSQIADQLMGQFRNRSGDEVSLSKNGNKLVLTDEKRQIKFIKDDESYFIAADPAQTSEPITFDTANVKPDRFWWGDDQYIRRDTDSMLPITFLMPPKEITGFVGKYENDDPWFGLMRIQVFGKRIILNGTTELFLAETDYFRLGGDTQSPERAHFYGFVGDRPQFMDISGVIYTRRNFDSSFSSAANN